MASENQSADPAKGQGSWRNTILAGLANYIDAGSIVAGSVALPLWVAAYHLSDRFVGLIGAFSANAISAGIGALVGGRLCDIFGRKTIYQFDMLFYAFGMMWLVFASQPWMIVLGFVLVGLAVGADIPASWSLIAENAPTGERAKHSGMAQILWYLGPVVVLVASLLLTQAPFNLPAQLVAQIVFGHLAVLAILLTFLRSRMAESQRWLNTKAERKASGRHVAGAWAELFRSKHLASIVFLVGMYGLWNLWAGTNGFFFPYILQTVGSQSQATSVALQALSFAIAMASIWLVFMQFADKVNQKSLFLISAVVQAGAMSLLAIFPLTLPIALLHIFLIQFAGGFGAQSFFQLWSAELFPTEIRSTAQGVAFAFVRVGLGVWSFFVPILTNNAGFHTLAWILVGFLVASGVVGLLGAPSNQGKSLEEIQVA